VGKISEYAGRRRAAPARAFNRRIEARIWPTSIHGDSTRLVPRSRGRARFGGFEDVEEIGQGGSGAVYRCRQVELDRMMAVKILTAGLDAVNLERFLHEQHAMGG
jgi:hypothetical protein